MGTRRSNERQTFQRVRENRRQEDRHEIAPPTFSTGDSPEGRDDWKVVPDGLRRVPPTTLVPETSSDALDLRIDIGRCH